MSKYYDEQFKKDAVEYYLSHKNLGRKGRAKNLGVRMSTLSKWVYEYKSTGTIEVRGSGNYASDEAKEIARLQTELRDTKDALEILKKAINILGS